MKIKSPQCGQHYASLRLSLYRQRYASLRRQRYVSLRHQRYANLSPALCEPPSPALCKSPSPALCESPSLALCESPLLVLCESPLSALCKFLSSALKMLTVVARCHDKFVSPARVRSPFLTVLQLTWGSDGMRIPKIYKSLRSGGANRHIIATPELTSCANHFITPYLRHSITNMRPPARTTRSNNNPGIVDLPKSRRSSADVATEKLKSKKIATANAKKKREQAAQVARVEEEIRTAQKEAAHSSGQGPKKRVKRTFSRETPASDLTDEVSSPLPLIALKYP